jgi:exodeoxyribonuclease V alpha subunit
MTAVGRLQAASQTASTVVSAHGLIAQFNDAGVLGPLDVLAASTIARLLGESDERVILAAAMAVRGTRFGHVCISLSALREAIVVEGQDLDVIDALPWPEPSTWERVVRSSCLVGDGTGDQPLVFSDGHLYLERYYRYEEQVGALIDGRCERAGRAIGPPALQMLARLLGSGAGTRQHEAAALALTSNISVIVGGPGTGKSHTVGALLAALAADGSDDFPLVGLCAPTGKAAARLGEAIAGLAATIENDSVRSTLATIQPSTIHRLLGWSRGRSQFRHSAANRLPHDLVIVDEMSMVSLPLAAKLLAAVRDDAVIVLVGDASQLESIEAGTVLADIVGPLAAGPASSAATPTAPIAAHVTVLDRVHRFEADSAIADFAEAIRSGNGDEAIKLLTVGGPQLTWVRGRSDTEFSDLWGALVDQRRRMVELARAPASHEQALGALGELAVLCAHRRGTDSVRQWSRDVETSLDDRFTGLRWDGEWYPGRPVMITRNDYTHELYNGDIGLTVETEAGLRVAFDRNGIRLFPLTQLSEHTTVHAMTIHKSQGSQFDDVVVVLPGEASRLLTRQLLYTAVTRASSRVWVVGDEQPVRAAIGRSVQRASGLGARLWGRSM